MPKTATSILLLLVLFSSYGIASAAVGTLAIGYLEFKDDPHYRETFLESRYPAQPWGRPFDGAQLAIKESRFAAMAVGVEFKLERRSAVSMEALIRAYEDLYADGVRFFVLDLPDGMVAELAARTKPSAGLLFNISALDDKLRQSECQSHLMHIVPSRVMLTDALAQFLVFKKWRSLLVLRGSQPGDDRLYAAFARSAKRFGLKIEDTKDFLLGRDPRKRDQNNVALLTAGVDYDVVYVVDSQSEFARDVPYQVQKSRPVVGAAGLVPDWWHWAWERNGAPQVNKRFVRLAKRHMTGYDWAAWMAVKIIAEAVLRTNSSNLAELVEYIRGDEFKVDGSKGYPLNFRKWNNQLRQPIFLTIPNWVVERAPLRGFLHQINNLDTLGFDERENQCRL